jgi:hypothetical protein
MHYRRICERRNDYARTKNGMKSYNINGNNIKNCLYAIFISLFFTAHVYAQINERGVGKFTYKSYAPFSNRPIEVLYYIPTQGDIDKLPIVFVFEGGDRGYGYLMASWKTDAEKNHFIAVFPHFDEKRFPVSEYQEIGVFNYKNILKAPSDIAPALIDKIFEYFKTTINSKQNKYNIYGHSAGGQFVQRFMLFHNSPYIDKAIIGSPGWYTFPDTTKDYPYGIRNVPYIRKEAICRFLSKNIILQLADGDTIRESFLRKTKESEEQGYNRLQRGTNFYEYIHRLAANLGIPCSWQKVVERNIGHNSQIMGHLAVPLLTNDSLRILFIGNSYTFFNDMPQMLKTIAVSNGIKLSVSCAVNPGWTLKQHLADQHTQEAIKRGGWNYVIIQENSGVPSKDKVYVHDNMFTAAISLDSIRSLFNPHGKTIFYMTWAHDEQDYAQTTDVVANNYLSIASRCNALCAPVGIAWKRVRQEKPQIELFNSDHSHPTAIGSYLTANVLYAMLSQRPYISTYKGGLPDNVALYLQRTAQEVVFSNTELWKINKNNQPKHITTTLYKNPDIVYHTPTLSKPTCEGLASIYEIQQYLRYIAKIHPSVVQISSIGTTYQGNDIPILFFNNQNKKKKLRIWIQTGLHGNEPAGPESACILIDYLLGTSEGQSILDKIDIALLPLANPDGYAMQNRYSGSNLDLNRDQSKLADSVSIYIKRVYTKWNPSIALDIHEFNPIHKDFKEVYHKSLSIPYDVMLLPSGHPNIPQSLQRITQDLFNENIKSALADKGYSSYTYFTTHIQGGKLIMYSAAKSPQSSSTYFSLTNTIGLFAEIRGIGLGRDSFARRAECGFIVAKSILSTILNNEREIRTTLKNAMKETIKRKNDVIVSFKSKQVDKTLSLLDLKSSKIMTDTLSDFNNLQTEPIIVRKRPFAYILTDSCKREVNILKTLGIDVKLLDKPYKAVAEQYTITRLSRQKEWEYIHPTNVETLIDNKIITFPSGSYMVPMSQKNANLAATLLEPESDNGFINFEITKVHKGSIVPIYRIISDL